MPTLPDQLAKLPPETVDLPPEEAEAPEEGVAEQEVEPEAALEGAEAAGSPIPPEPAPTAQQPTSGPAVKPAPAPDHSAELTALRQERERLQQEVEQHRETAAMAALRNDGAVYEKSLIDQGYTPEQAKHLSNATQQVLWQKYQLQKTAERMNHQSKETLARQLAQQYGVEEAVLAGYDTPQTMEQAAKTLGQNNKRVAELEEQVKKLTRQNVPAQGFSQPGRGATNVNSRARRMDAYINGTWRPQTPKEHEELNQLLNGG